MLYMFLHRYSILTCNLDIIEHLFKRKKYIYLNIKCCSFQYILRNAIMKSYLTILN